MDSSQSRYQVGDRVLFHSKEGKPHHGSVQWIGTKEGVPYSLVGIKTVSILVTETNPNSLMLCYSRLPSRL